MESRNWILIAAATGTAYFLFKAWTTEDTRINRKSTFPAGKKHVPRPWKLVLADKWFYPKLRQYVLRYAKVLLFPSPHDENTCELCTWRDKNEGYFDIMDAICAARQGCQFGSCIEQSVKAFCDPNPLEMVTLSITTYPDSNVQAFYVGNFQNEGWNRLELYITEDEVGAEGEKVKRPRFLEAMKPQRHVAAAGTTTNKLDLVKHLTDKCMHGTPQTGVCSALSSLMEKCTPKRLLEISRKYSEEGLIVTLCEDLVLETGSHYSCLSYCWGGDQPFKLTNNTANELRQGKPIDLLPATLRDAVLVSFELDVRYIWIDALCIFQDSPEDWVQQSSQMGRIYSSGLFTICAARAESASSGFLQEDIRPEPLPCKALVAGNTQQIWARPQLPHETSSDGDRDKRAQMRRAWTFQEYLLSTRCLRFEDDEVIWECSEGFGCIWGIKPLWQLCWHVFDAGELWTKLPRRPKGYRAPSWSWASIEWVSGWRDLTHLHKEPLPVADIINMSCTGVACIGSKEEDNVLTLWTFVRVRSEQDCSADILKGVTYDCGEAQARAAECKKLWFVALSKLESEEEGHRFEYQVLVCEEAGLSRLRRLGMNIKVADLEGFTRDTVHLI